MTRRDAWPISILLLVIALAMGRIVLNGFTGWDDPHTITENPAMNPPTLSSTFHYWSHDEAGLYIPVTYTAWELLATLGRSSDGVWHAWPFHLASLLAHCIGAITVYLILAKLLAAKHWFTPLIGATLFAIHPLQVESVAWAAGLKDVLAGMFGLLALNQHLLAADRDRTKNSRTIHHAFTATFFALAMLSKPSAATLIAVAAMIDLLIREKTVRATFTSLAPGLLIALPLLIIARVVQDTGNMPTPPRLERIHIAGDALAFYILKLFVPAQLALDYGRSPRFVIASTAPFIAWLLPLAILGIALLARSRVLIAACLIFVAALSINLGFSTFQFQFYSTVADHYVYVAMFGVALAAASIAQRAQQSAALVVCTITLSIFAVLTFRQAGIWNNSIALFEHSLAVNPNSAPNHGNLGRALGESGQYDAAIAQFDEVIRLAPYDPDARRNLALIAQRQGRLDEAVRYLAQSIDLNQRGGAPPGLIDHDRHVLMQWMMIARQRKAPPTTTP